MKYAALPLIAAAFLLGGCSEIIKPTPESVPAPSVAPAEQAAVPERPTSPMEKVLRAELQADTPARVVLETGRKLALEEQEVIRGGCWNWINTVFNRSGYADQSHVVFKGRKKGPFVSQDEIQPGDWLYYINHSYRQVGHSGLFVHWVDYDRKIGMVLSYAGEGRREPARYKAYDLTNVYYIKRPGENPTLVARDSVHKNSS